MLHLYRALLRSAKAKDPTLSLYAGVANEFRQKASSVSSREFGRIEHMLRTGYKQKKTMEMPGFTNMYRPKDQGVAK